MTAAGFAGVKVLIVEDQPIESQSLARLLRVIGIENVTVVEDGTTALELMSETKVGALDLVISDVEMPDMDGYELVRRISYGTVPRFKDIPIIVLTGYFTDDNARHARTHRINGVVVKPLSGEVMMRKVEEVLGRPAF